MIVKPSTPDEKRKWAEAYMHVVRKFVAQDETDKLNWLLQTNYFEVNAIHFTAEELAELRDLQTPVRYAPRYLSGHRASRNVKSQARRKLQRSGARF